MNSVLNNEYSVEFDNRRKNAVEVSFYKYGPARENFGSGRVDAIKKDGNTEHLIDIANYAMFRYVYPLPGESYKPTDSNGSVGTVGTPINMEEAVTWPGLR